VAGDGVRARPSLQDAVAEHGPLPAATVYQIVAGALQAIHSAGVIHLKPSNMLLAPGRPRDRFRDRRRRLAGRLLSPRARTVR
jgi:hypothetical protein